MMGRVIFITFFILRVLYGNAQLQANFTMDQASGCSPHEVKFTNSTTGASGGVQYSWDLGNGNSASLPNPGAIYNEEKTYTVTLIATDGGIKSIISKKVMVYKKPTVGLTADPARGCAPVSVTIASTVDPGDGTIVKYLWDFGDGTTLTGQDARTVKHVYTVAQNPPVSLTIINSLGCNTTLSKPDLIQVYKAIEAAFTASPTVMCVTGNPVKFTNNTLGDGTLNYLWDFGDGQTSIEIAPSHIYTISGIYKARLKVKNDIGCTGNAKPVKINVNSLKADFALPEVNCVGKKASFSNKSSRPYDSLRWQIDNVTVPATAYGNLSYRFSAIGDYAVKLVVYYGNCIDSISKTVNIGTKPGLKGFEIQTDNACSLPVTFTFTDTTQGAVKWEWRYKNNTEVFDSARVAVHEFTDGETDEIGLKITNAWGCSSSKVKTIKYYPTNIAITINSSSPAASPNRGCPGMEVKFGTNPPDEVISAAWNFGDGTVSGKAKPTHVYNELGSYGVTLDYVTKTGCKGIARFDSIFITGVQPSDFVASDILICGNSPVTFTPGLSLPNRDYIWLVNGKRVQYSLTPEPYTHRFDKEGLYSISLVIRAGACSDTITKTDYITVVPPFPDIKSAENTCAGNRGMVTFTDTSRNTSSWSWDFGDGNTANYTSFQPTISHNYLKTGNYNVTLTATMGNCTVSDSLLVHVLLKQQPLLKVASTTACTGDSPAISLSGFETHPAPDSSQPYEISALQFGDLTLSNATINTGGPWTTSFRGNINGFETGKQNIRIITSSHYFGCFDTSNFAPLKIIGPLAGFSFKPVKCYKQPLVLKDTSNAAPGIPVVKWEWFFGDGSSLATANGGNVTHQYKNPGTYQLSLRVTDAGGCVHQTPADSGHMVSFSGPEAAFDASASDVLVNSTVNFFNRSVYQDSSELFWLFSDGSVSTENDPSFLFAEEGAQQVRLVIDDPLSGCPDTALKMINVKRVQSAFTYQGTYTDSGNCPPVIVKFKIESVNADYVRWTFGDGGEAGNEQEVSHIYTRAGNFPVTLYSYDSSGQVDSLTQVFQVKGPYAVLKADTLYGCNTLGVKLSADTSDAVSFKWDFGDGTIASTTDTFATHIYTITGIYTPSLILTNRGGCSSTSGLDQKIIVDSLAASFSASPDSMVCDSALVTFTPVVSSLSKEKLDAPLLYRWTSAMHPNDVFITERASWIFNRAGLHNVQLQVESPYGCKVNVTKQVDIKQGVTAVISGPVMACPGDSVLFKGNSLPEGGDLHWQWQLGNNTRSDLQNPAAVAYQTAGRQLVSLIVNNAFCQDTAHYTLDVNEFPLLTFGSSKPFVCSGNTLLLTATGGSSIRWTPSVNSTTNGGYNAIVQPAINTFYTANIIDSAGCTAKDSIEVKVVNPFSMQVVSPVFACSGAGVQLSATGAYNYQWTGNGLNSNASNPFIVATAPAVYTVIGYDGFNCFTDTASVTLNVAPLPTINAGPDQTLAAGQEIKLTVSGSNDVVKWNWQPATYLQCTDCPSPLCKPYSDVNYVLTVTNNAGCTASDTVRIEVLCDGNRIYIPTGFTPNSDNLNDRFAVYGNGMHINRLAVFDRWGKLVFERKDASPSDRNSSWDGTYKNQPMASGSYVYFLEARCNSGKVFSFKGAVTLVR